MEVLRTSQYDAILEPCFKGIMVIELSPDSTEFLFKNEAPLKALNAYTKFD